ncbi:unnamed protein product [Effrenium voratum]|nr:unnamed protein product [Effrenium voratum]
MLSEMFAHAQKGLQVKTPSNTPNARRRENHRDRGSPAHDEFQIMEPVTLQEPTLSRVPSVPSHVGGSPSAEKKALLAYNQLLEARLRAVTEENRGLRLQHQQDELHLRQSQRELDLRMEGAQSKAPVVEGVGAKCGFGRHANLKLYGSGDMLSKAAMVFNAWFRVAAQALARWRAAEAAVVWQVESERTQHGHLLRAEEAERQSARLEAALERQQRRFAQEEHEAQEAQQQSWALQTSSMQVGKKVQALTEQLSRREALLVEERHRLRHEERQAREMKLAMSDLQVAHDESREGLAQRLAKTEATLAEERMRADTSRMESKEAGRQLMALQSKVSDSSILENDSKELRQQLLAQQAAKVEAERQVGLLEVEVNKLSCKLRLSESELADAKSQEARHVRIATQEAREAGAGEGLSWRDAEPDVVDMLGQTLVLGNDALTSLVGIWRDEQGSRYELEIQVPGKSLNVTTFRPDGGVRNTPGLIRIQTGRDNVETVVWGKSFKLQLDSGVVLSAPDSILWVANDGRRRSFSWARVAPYNPPSSTQSERESVKRPLSTRQDSNEAKEKEAEAAAKPKSKAMPKASASSSKGDEAQAAQASASSKAKPGPAKDAHAAENSAGDAEAGKDADAKGAKEGTPQDAGEKDAKGVNVKDGAQDSKSAADVQADAKGEAESKEAKASEEAEKVRDAKDAKDTKDSKDTKEGGDADAKAKKAAADKERWRVEKTSAEKYAKHKAAAWRSLHLKFEKEQAAVAKRLGQMLTADAGVFWLRIGFEINATERHLNEKEDAEKTALTSAKELKESLDLDKAAKERKAREKAATAARLRELEANEKLAKEEKSAERFKREKGSAEKISKSMTAERQAQEKAQQAMTKKEVTALEVEALKKMVAEKEKAQRSAYEEAALEMSKAMSYGAEREKVQKGLAAKIEEEKALLRQLEEVRQEKEALDLMVKLKDAAEKKAFQDARSLEKKATKIAKEIKSSGESLAKVEKEHEAAHSEVLQYETAAKKACEGRSAAEKKAKERANNNPFVKSVEDAKAEVDAALKGRKAAERAADDASSMYKALEERLGSAESSADRAARQRSAVEAELRKLRRQHETASQKLDEMQAQVQKAEEERNRAEKAAAEATARLRARSRSRSPRK